MNSSLARLAPPLRHLAMGGALLAGPLWAAAAEPEGPPPIASAYEAAKKTRDEMDRAVLAAAYLDARKETVRLHDQLRDLRRSLAAAAEDAAARDRAATEVQRLLVESVDRRTRAELAQAAGEAQAREIAAAAADRQAKEETIRAMSDQRLDHLRDHHWQAAKGIVDGLAGSRFGQVDARWLADARTAAADLEAHLRLAGIATAAWTSRVAAADRLDGLLATGEADLQDGATEAAQHLHPVKQSLEQMLAAMKDHFESAKLLEDLPGGTSRYSLLVGWRHSQFEDGSGNRPMAGVMVYHHFRSALAPQITVAALFTGAEYKDKQVASTGLVAGATAVESLQTSQSFLFGGSLYWPMQALSQPMDLDLDGFADGTWAMGPVLKAGAYVRSSETDQGNSTQANGAAGLRFSLGSNAFLDLCYGQSQELYSDRLVLGVQMPIVLFGSQKPANRLFFTADGTIGLHQLPTHGVEGQLQNDDVFRFSLVLEIPVQSLARKFSIPYLSE